MIRAKPMPLASGTRLGGYDVLTAIGAGGMGEVYRARDAKLNRDVAIKVLPEIFANDPDRLARFEREARSLAALNHPNIAHVYGLERQESLSFIVMELIERTQHRSTEQPQLRLPERRVARLEAASVSQTSLTCECGRTS